MTHAGNMGLPSCTDDRQVILPARRTPVHAATRPATCGRTCIIRRNHRMTTQCHPPTAGARLLRGLRALRYLKGWGALANVLAPARLTGPFTVSNAGIAFSGDIGSFIDRETYLFGQYEERPIRLFLSCVPPQRRRTILDVGANAGTHSLAFSRHFRRVESFEPNPALWPQFRRNVALNGFDNVTLHEVGLGAEDAMRAFHLIEKRNYGLGTFSTVEQYDLPLRQVGTCRVAPGDDYLAAHGIDAVDAVKIDVQGFEIEVLRGLRATLAEYRPLVWLEMGAATRTAAHCNSLADLQAYFPYPTRVLFIASSRGLLTWSTVLQDARPDLPGGDYIVLPAESAGADAAV